MCSTSSGASCSASAAPITLWPSAGMGRAGEAPRSHTKGPQQLPEVVTIGGEPAEPTQKFIVGERLEIARLFPEGAFRQAETILRDAFAAAADDLHPAVAQFRDFIHHVRFERTRKLVSNVGDGHAADSSDAHSIPATVNTSPMTNWYAMSTKQALNRYTLSTMGQTLRRAATGPRSPGGLCQERRNRLKKRMQYRASPGTPNSTSKAR